MFQRCLTVLGLTFGLLVLSATPALASIGTANATTTCGAYSLALSASGLTPGSQYIIDYSIEVSPGSSGFPLIASIPFTAPASGTFTDTVTGSFPTLVGSFTFSGTASLMPIFSKADPSTTNISFSPSTLTCGPAPTPACSVQSANSSNFNGTSMIGGDYVWFNANFTATGIPSSGATVSLTGSTISFTEGGTQYQLVVPNAQIVFSPSATCSSTTFSTMTNTWTTTVPVKGDDEIFLTGLAWPVPSGGLVGGINPVNWGGATLVRTAPLAFPFSGNGVRPSIRTSRPTTTLSASRPVTKLRVDKTMATTLELLKASTTTTSHGNSLSLAAPAEAEVQIGPARGAARRMSLPRARPVPFSIRVAHPKNGCSFHRV